MNLRLNFNLFLMPLLWQLISCSNVPENNVEHNEVLTINTDEINFESIYRVNNDLIKDPLPVDTIYLKLKFKESFKKVVYANDVEVVPNIKGCYIQKQSHHNYKIYFDDSLNSQELIWTLYLKPTEGTVYDKNKKQSYNRNDRVFIAEKHNNLSTRK